MHLVKIACERLDDVGRSLSHWDWSSAHLSTEPSKIGLRREIQRLRSSLFLPSSRISVPDPDIDESFHFWSLVVVSYY